MPVRVDNEEVATRAEEQPLYLGCVEKTKGLYRLTASRHEAFMAIDKIVASFDEAVADIRDGAVMLVSSFGAVISTPLLTSAVAT